VKSDGFANIADKVPHTPCYVVDEGKLKQNLEILEEVQRSSGCKIVMALKGFAMFSTFGLIKQYIKGTAASSLHEARLGYEEFGSEVHVFSPAYLEEEFSELTDYATHINFNSFSQWEHFKGILRRINKPIKCGLRINPEHSEVKVKLYDPCAPGSRLGIRKEEFKGKNLDGITGLHFHNLCELNADALERTLEKVEENFGEILKNMEWVNFGGGHHITRSDYNVDLLGALIKNFKEKYALEVYLEPGEAIALNTGVLVATVKDIVQNRGNIAILDTSAAAHMPDVLEMPYRPMIEGSGEAGEYEHTYRLGGLSCLAGDVIGEYSFKDPLKVGDRLTFNDMAHYTMVKNNTFNGVKLPSIAIYSSGSNKVRVVKQFGYEG